MPNACNLCHLDKSLAWTLVELEKGWDKKISLTGSLESLYGQGLQRPAGEALLDHPFQAARLVAASAYARSPIGKTVLPQLIGFLNEPNAYARMRYLMSTEKVLGKKLSDDEYSLMGSPELRKRQIQNLRSQNLP